MILLALCVGKVGLCQVVEQNLSTVKKSAGFLFAVSVKLLRHCPRSTVVLRLGLTFSRIAEGRLAGSILAFGQSAVMRCLDLRAVEQQIGQQTEQFLL